MMRSSNSKIQGKTETVNSESPLENGLPSKEEEDERGENVRQLAEKVVEEVVKKASEAAEQRTSDHHHQHHLRSQSTKNRGCNLQRLPTIQIDTVASPPPSPDEWTPPDETDEVEEPLDESDIQLDLETVEEEPDNSSEDLKESLKSYVEDILSQAMVLAEKKLQFAGLPEDDEENDEASDEEPPVHPPPSEPEKNVEEEIDESEIRATAEKVVQEIIEQASEKAADALENLYAGLTFPGLPSIHVDSAPSPPPSPETEEEEETVRPPSKKTKWTFKDDEDSGSEKNLQLKKKEPKKPPVVKFEDAPEDVREAAEKFIKEIVGKAIAMAEEKSVPTVPFNFEDVDLMKTSGPWYIRAREALIRLLRTACFCTPRRTDS